MRRLTFAKEMSARAIIRSAALFSSALLVAVSCSRAPRSVGADGVIMRDYAAPILDLSGNRIGETEMSYWIEPYVPSGHQDSNAAAYRSVRWNCRIHWHPSSSDSGKNGNFSWGGNLLFEVSDLDRTEWALGYARAGSGEPIETEGVSDTALVPAAAAARLGAPHWHLLCGGTDMIMRCGPVKERKRD
jgi:hypothetical protein